MTKEEFLSLMHFPKEWLELDMYPDELFLGQISRYEPGHEDGSEHFRYGAFHWWLRKQPNRQQLENLLRFAALDPDLYMGVAARSDIMKAAALDEDLIKLDKELFAGRSIKLE